MSEQPAPVAPAARIAELDVLRGVGVLGILMVNAAAFALPMEAYQNPAASPFGLAPLSAGLWWFTHVFFEQKFVTLFSALFGVSIYLVGGERGDEARARVLHRRLFWLMLIGAAHGALVWWGDILLSYALVGFVMAGCRSWSARRLAIVGAVLFAFGALLNVGIGLALAGAPAGIQAQAAAAWSPPAEVVRQLVADYRGDLGSVTAENFADWTLVGTISLLLFGWRTLAVMMIGLALFKTGVLQGRRSRGVYVALVGLAVPALAVIGWSGAASLRAGFPFPEALGVDTAPNYLLSPVVTAGYVGAVVLVLRAGLFRSTANRLAAVGRMAFTNYLAQSLIMTTIFYGGRGLGLYGQLDWPERTVLVIAVWALQLAWSPLWLSRFTMGPLEWVWRTLSYGRAAPLRRPPY